MCSRSHALRSPAPDTMAMYTATVLTIFFLLSGQSARADNDQHDHHRFHKRNLTIAEVVVTFDDAAYGGVDTITIGGEGFGFGRSMTVTLGSFPDPLRILSATATEIVVECPTTMTGSTCPSGDYLLTLSTARGKRRNDEWELTIGAIGPQGEQGPPGEQGPRGEPVLIGRCPEGEFVVGFDANGFICAGMDADTGEPGTPGGACGGIAGIPCPDGLTCVDDPRDDCDPTMGGADCGGICAVSAM